MVATLYFQKKKTKTEVGKPRVRVFQKTCICFMVCKLFVIDIPELHCHMGDGLGTET